MIAVVAGVLRREGRVLLSRRIRGADVGRYTGYYYTFSMAAQIVTPMVSGWLLEHAGYGTLFPYAAGMVVVSFITMLFVRHGDAKPEKAKSMLENFDAGD